MYKIVSTATNFTHNGELYGETNTILFSGVSQQVSPMRITDRAVEEIRP